MTILNSCAAVAAGRIASRHRPHQRVSAAGQPFVAVLRRIPGIGAMKVSKVSAELRRDVPFIPPHYHNASTVESYFQVWPRRRAAFVMYGGDSWGSASANRVCTKASGPSVISRRAFTSAAAGASGSPTALAEAASIVDTSEVHLPYASLGSASHGQGLAPSTSANSSRNAVRLLKEGGADAVKLEGGRRVAPQVQAIADAGIAVVGHIGLTPQTASAQGGFGVRGRGVVAAMKLLDDAVAIQDAGACALVLEMVPHQLAAEISSRLSIPTIGIGAGGATSGQVQVMPDILGSLTPNPHTLKHAQLFARPSAVGDIALDALRRYKQAVENNTFPSINNGSSMTQRNYKMLQTSLQEWDSAVRSESTTIPSRDTPADQTINTQAKAVPLPEPVDPLQQRIVVIGGGAMGSLFASLLAQGMKVIGSASNNEPAESPRVHLVTSWTAHAATIHSAGGLLVEDTNGQATIASSVAPITADEAVSSSHIEAADIVIVLTKSEQTQRAAVLASKLLSPCTDQDGVSKKLRCSPVVLTLQNGFSNLEEIQSKVGPDRAMAGVTTLASTVARPGSILRTDGGTGVTTIAPGTASQAVAADAVAVLLQAAGARARVLPVDDGSPPCADDDIALPALQAMQWRKAIANTCINPLTAILAVPNGAFATSNADIGTDALNPFASLRDQVAHEVVSVLDAVEDEAARRNGWPIPTWSRSTASSRLRRSRLLEIARSTAEATACNTSSMLADLQRPGVTPELDSILGHIQRQGSLLGVQTPLLHMLRSMVEAKAQVRDSYSNHEKNRSDDMVVVRNVHDLRRALECVHKTHRIGLVATMGALHDGHISLVEAARNQAGCDVVVATIFVNPTQFGPGEDFDSYPRTEEADLLKLRSAGVDLAFVPDAVCASKDLFPADHGVFVETSAGSQPDSGEGSTRPGFFRGVATIVTKLLNLVRPDVALFGQKDGQQCAVVEQLVQGLNLSTEIVRVDTVRESDGLAMSSRNKKLNEAERAAAPAIFAALTATRAFLEKALNRPDSSAVVPAAELESVFLQALDDHVSGLAINGKVPLKTRYFAVTSARTACPMSDVSASSADARQGGVMLSAGVSALQSGTQLIDNVIIQRKPMGGTC
eukprot:INCI11342.1.p1 GENE.INCI11342.1~~INCI11342.1.p1  ORF type:complete len:1118 (+),score=198.77 INCI11342.1:163-3516(+)